LVDPPKTEAIVSAISELKSLGAIDENERITKIGKCMSLLPVEPIYAKLILTAVVVKEFQPVLSDIVAIVAMISCQHVFYSRSDKDKGEKRIIENPLSDHLTLLNAYNISEKLKHKETPSFLNMRAVRNAHDIHNQIMEYCKDIFSKLSITPITHTEPKDKPALVGKCLYRGMPLNIAKRITDQEKPEETKGVCYKAKVNHSNN
jgi:HrpA-like RNA helicase